jgi:hypothetical protein
MERNIASTDMLHSSKTGLSTSIKALNCDIVKRGREYAFSYEMHELMMQLIKEKAEIAALHRQEQKDERAKGCQTSTEFRDYPIPSRGQIEIEEPKDRLQIKRVKKEQSQRARRVGS